jgi:3-oxoacyl-[acyl-carrier-protein] synthase-3
MTNPHESIGILSTAIYLPETYMSSADLSEASGIPQDVIERKMGITRKPVPGPDDHSCEMGIRAAREALRKAKLDPLEIDLVIYIGESIRNIPYGPRHLSCNRK